MERFRNLIGLVFFVILGFIHLILESPKFYFRKLKFVGKNFKTWVTFIKYKNLNVYICICKGFYVLLFGIKRYCGAVFLFTGDLNDIQALNKKTQNPTVTIVPDKWPEFFLRTCKVVQRIIVFGVQKRKTTFIIRNAQFTVLITTIIFFNFKKKIYCTCRSTKYPRTNTDRVAFTRQNNQIGGLLSNF